MLPENDYQIIKLSHKFYQDYPNPPFTELEQKENRQYTCLLFQTHYDFFICIPFRSNIRHRYAFHFTHSARSRKSKSGLDYTKIVIISKTEYLDSKQAYVDKDEFLEMIHNFPLIKQKALSYVEDYISHLNHTQPMHPQEFKRKYTFSTLPYFHSQLSLTSPSSPKSHPRSHPDASDKGGKSAVKVPN